MREGPRPPRAAKRPDRRTRPRPPPRHCPSAAARAVPCVEPKAARSTKAPFIRRISRARDADPFERRRREAQLTRRGAAMNAVATPQLNAQVGNAACSCQLTRRPHLTLSGAGVYSFFHCGVTETLLDAGQDIHGVVGVSGGNVAGVYTLLARDGKDVREVGRMLRPRSAGDPTPEQRQREAAQSLDSRPLLALAVARPSAVPLGRRAAGSVRRPSTPR